jgi:protein-S-isoprenylcysteine O-methyltransferase Ste14
MAMWQLSALVALGLVSVVVLFWWVLWVDHTHLDLDDSVRSAEEREAREEQPWKGPTRHS